ncbi:MAG TPA: hypothetical protein VHC21_02500 [Candidatus Saccharimonadales bacterium]|nr:hypothetical protein [Candidatus Saccharimonadales bacterium]
MEKQRNEQLLTPKPLASRHWASEARRGDDDRQTQRQAEAKRIYKNRLVALGAIGVAMVAGAAAGSGRLLVHDTEQGARDAFNNRVEAVNDAFSNPSQGVVTGEPSTSQAEHQVQVNEAHNAAVAAAEDDQLNAQSK